MIELFRDFLRGGLYNMDLDDGVEEIVVLWGRPNPRGVFKTLALHHDCRRRRIAWAVWCFYPDCADPTRYMLRSVLVALEDYLHPDAPSWLKQWMEKRQPKPPSICPGDWWAVGGPDRKPVRVPAKRSASGD